MNASGVVAIVACALVLLGGCAYVVPQYAVYSNRMDGEAKLAEAESSRRIAVLEAQAKLDSAAKLSEAEVARAKGVAEANRIIGHSLQDNEAYLRYLWIHSLELTKDKVIYVPTEANLPILEAKRLEMPPPPAPEGEESK